MKKKNTVFLLIGQRGSGKSSYCKRLLEAQPGLSAVSRDEILIRKFGSVHTDPYSGAGHYAFELMTRILRRKLGTQSGINLILDCWTGESRERRSLIRALKGFGATRVVGLYFITPLELVEKWFWQKPGIAKFSEMRTRKEEGLSYFYEDAPRRDYEIFHQLASSIDENGFDKVIRIDPRNELVTLI